MQLDLILPAYNPEEDWQTYALERIRELSLLRPKWSIRLIVTTDGSTRGHSNRSTHELAEEMCNISPQLEQAFIFINPPNNHGKGHCLRDAITQTQDSNPEGYTLYTDWDFPFTTGSYLDTLDTLDRGADIVLPIRDTSLYMQHLGSWRKFLSRSSRIVNSLLLALPNRDTQGGIKAFNHRGRGAFLETKINRFLFDTEFIALATKKQLNILLTTSTVRPDIQMSHMSWRTLRRELHNIPRLFQARWFY